MFQHNPLVPSWRVKQSKKNRFWTAAWLMKVGSISPSKMSLTTNLCCITWEEQRPWHMRRITGAIDTVTPEVLRHVWAEITCSDICLALEGEHTWIFIDKNIFWVNLYFSVSLYTPWLRKYGLHKLEWISGQLVYMITLILFKTHYSTASGV
jgi:hypothetical protein